MMAPEQKRDKDNGGVIHQTPFDEMIDGDSTYKGFCCTFMMFIGMYLFKLGWEYQLQYGHLPNDLIQILGLDLWWIARMEILMYLGMFTSFSVISLVKVDLLNWYYSGWTFMALYELFYLFSFNYLVRRCEWITRVLIFLHSCAQVMKIHSYAFTLGSSAHQQRITLRDFFMYTMYPTLVYETNFVRTSRVRLGYLIKRMFLILVMLYSLVIVIDCSMGPIVTEIAQTPVVSATTVITNILKLFPSMFLLCCLAFYLVWECLLNVIAELTYFADRDFYKDWWNSGSILEFCNTWNRSVHKFLKRHVYLPTVRQFNGNKFYGIVAVFLLSGLVHELALFVIFQRPKTHFILLFMSQLPVIMVQSPQWTRSNRMVANFLFSVYIVLGPSFLTVMYHMC